MSEDINLQQEQFGTITFANGVLETIAAMATCNIPGVAGMSGGFVGGIAEMLGKKNLTKGVKASVGEANTCTINLEIIVDLGVRIPDVCKQIQESVVKSVETMTGLKVEAVNIAVDGIKFPTSEPTAIDAEEITTQE